MRSRYIIAPVMALSMWTSTAAQQKERCGTRQPGVDELAQIEQQVARARGKKVAPDATFPVWVHVISKGSGFANGQVSDAMIRAQIRVLNDSFSGSTGGAPSGFAFELAGITRTTNQTWFESIATDFDVELAAKQVLHRGGPETLNIYTVDGGPYLGFAYYPSVLTDPQTAPLDGVVVDWRSLPGGTFEIYSEGDTATHEVGHWLALFHTFDGKCGSKGDSVSDTPSEFAPAFNCPVGRDSCQSRPGLDPIFNFMDYTQDS
jgi:hypothetical protein